MKTYDQLNVWTNDPLIGQAARQILAIAKKHNNPTAPFMMRPVEYDIPFPYTFIEGNEAKEQIFRRVGVLFASLDVHCYWRDKKQCLGVAVNAGDKEAQRWAAFVEEGIEVILDFINTVDLS